MAQTSKDWPIILDETSYSHLVELSHSLSKVEGLIKKLVDGEYQSWYDKNNKWSQNCSSAENHSWGNWCDNSATGNEDNNNKFDWFQTATGDESNDAGNNLKCDFSARWDDGWNTEPNWSNNTSKSETSIDWDTTKVSQSVKAIWESGWENSNSVESNQEKIDWETTN